MTRWEEWKYLLHKSDIYICGTEYWKPVPMLFRKKAFHYESGRWFQTLSRLPIQHKVRHKHRCRTETWQAYYPTYDSSSGNPVVFLHYNLHNAPVLHKRPSGRLLHLSPSPSAPPISGFPIRRTLYSNRWFPTWSSGSVSLREFHPILSHDRSS